MPKQVLIRLVDADAFLWEMRHLYSKAGWDPNEIHFSLNDLESNLDSMPTFYSADQTIGYLYSRIIDPETKEETDTECL